MFDERRVVVVDGPTRQPASSRVLKYNFDATLKYMLIMKRGRCTRDTMNEMLAALHDEHEHVAPSLKIARRLVAANRALVPVRHCLAMQQAYRDPIDIIVSVLRAVGGKECSIRVRTNRTDCLSSLALAQNPNLRTEFDANAVDSARSRENYRIVSTHFAAAQARGFKLVCFDLYMDAFEVVKARKRCAVRVRVVGDKHWYEVTQLDNVGLLDRTVSHLSFGETSCVSRSRRVRSR